MVICQDAPGMAVFERTLYFRFLEFSVKVVRHTS